MMEIVTNNQSRVLLDWEELSSAEQAEYPVEQQYRRVDYTRFKGRVYCVDEFVTTTTLPQDHPFRKWDGYSADSAFSGVLIRYDKHDYDRVVLARYYS